MCASLTPLDRNGDACVDLLVAHCRGLLDAGCSGLVLLGTTGEANSFTIAERCAILEGTLAGGISAADLIVGTGCCAIGDSVALTKHALSLGVERVLMLPPFYYKNLQARGIIDAYARTIEAVAEPRLRVYLYQIPQLTGVPIGADVIEALLASYPQIIAGIKDSSGDWSAIQDLCARFGDRLDVLAGNERYLLKALRAGASGCVTATANANAGMICRLYQRRDDFGAETLQAQVVAVRDVFEAYPMIAALKEVAANRSGDARWRNLRPPLIELTSPQQDALLESLQDVLAVPEKA